MFYSIGLPSKKCFRATLQTEGPKDLINEGLKDQKTKGPKDLRTKRPKGYFCDRATVDCLLLKFSLSPRLYAE